MHTSKYNIILTLTSEQPIPAAEQIAIVKRFCTIKNTQEMQLNDTQIDLQLSDIQPTLNALIAVLEI